MDKVYEAGAGRRESKVTKRAWLSGRKTRYSKGMYGMQQEMTWSKLSCGRVVKWWIYYRRWWWLLQGEGFGGSNNRWMEMADGW